MKVMFLPKYKYDEGVFVERSMPCEGSLSVKKGSIVKAFEKLGECKEKEQEKSFNYYGTLAKKRGDYISQGEVVAWSKRFGAFIKTDKSPFTGYIISIDKEKREIFVRKPSRIIDLISGAPGIVENAIEGRGVLIKTKAVRLIGVCGLGEEDAGELIVWGNYNTKLLPEHVDLSFSNKIVACGYLTKEAYAKGKAVGVLGFISGGMNVDSFMNVFPGPGIVVLEGFGDARANSLVFKYLKTIKSRFVVIRAFDHEVIIPENSPPKTFITSTFSKDLLYVDLEIGHTVQIFSFSNYGLFGTVVELDEKAGAVQVKIWEKEEKVLLPGENVGVVG